MQEILVECFPDESLLLELGVPKKQIRHTYGISRIANLLEKSTDYIAMVDEDPGGTIPPYLKNTPFIRIELESIILGQDEKRSHFIFRLCPRV